MSESSGDFPEWSDEFDLDALREPTIETRRALAGVIEGLPYTGTNTMRNVHYVISDPDDTVKVLFAVACTTFTHDTLATQEHLSGYVGLQFSQGNNSIVQTMGGEPLDEERRALIADTVEYIASNHTSAASAAWIRRVHESSRLAEESLTAMYADDLLADAPCPVNELATRNIIRSFSDGSTVRGFVSSTNKLSEGVRRIDDGIPGVANIALTQADGKKYVYTRLPGDIEELIVMYRGDEIAESASDTTDEDRRLGVSRPTDGSMQDFTRALTQATTSQIAA